MLFLIRITETHFPHSLETETQLCHKMCLIPMRYYIHPNPCNIDRDVITPRKFTGFGKSVCRAVWEGLWHCLECCISGLVIVESIRVLGPSFNSQKKTSFVQDSCISYCLQLVCPISPLLLYQFHSHSVSPESYFRGESSAVCYEGRGL